MSRDLQVFPDGDQHRIDPVSEGRPAPPGDDARARKPVDPWLVGRELGDPIFQWELGVAVGEWLGKRK